jgi:Cu-processing system ATP-binding protein
MIRIEQLNKSFKKLKVLHDFTVCLSKGQVISLVGPNASGKTTLMKCILGMVKQDSGNIYFNDMDIKGDWNYRHHIGYMSQIARYPDNMHVGQLIKMIKDIRSKGQHILDEELIQKFQLKNIFSKKMSSLSGGTRQKVSVALAFLFNPEVLILDEPTAGLDPVSSELLKEKILKEKERNKLIIITSHILSDIDAVASHIMYLQEGQLKFFKDINTLKQEFNESRLEKAIAKVMNPLQGE